MIHTHLPLISIILAIFPSLSSAAELTSPRIESVVPLGKQSQQDDKATIWYDDFNADTWKDYKEKSGTLDDSQSYGDTGKSLQCFYLKGTQGKGGAKVFFGDSPYGGGQVVKGGERFTEIYVRLYVRHQDGWHGGCPAKLMRATSITASNWSQAMISHVWKGKTDCLTLDPVRAVSGSKVLTTKYNDWGGLKWLGNSPSGNFPISSTRESGVWYCVEMRVKLNSPGKSDGENQLWIDGRLDAERKGMNFVDTYTKHALNAVFIESYWNTGAPADLSRWYDNFVISTKRIGFMQCPDNPTIVRAIRPWEKKSQAWECEIAGDVDGKNIVFASKIIVEDRFVVNKKSGKFTKNSKLKSGTYYCRARQQAGNEWTKWSPWHQGFEVVAEKK